MNNFERSLHFTAKWEGIDFTNDSADPGGKTKYGIADAGDGKVDGLADIDGNGTGDIKIEDLTPVDAAARLRNVYWIGSGCERLPLPLAVVVFDSAVNCGVGRAKRWLQESQDPKEIIRLRRQYYYRIVDARPTLKKFLNGWINRINDLHKYVDILVEESRD